MTESEAEVALAEYAAEELVAECESGTCECMLTGEPCCEIPPHPARVRERALALVALYRTQPGPPPWAR